MAHQIRVKGVWVGGLPTEAGQRYRIACGSDYIYKVHTPEVIAEPESTKMTKLGFKQRFTQQERINIHSAAASNLVVYDFQDLVDSATYIDIARQDTIDSVSALEQFGLIGAGRAAEILSAPVTDIEKFEG